MVIGAFPVAKLSVLLIKQISKPIANMCKERAKSHPFFRTYVCMPPATFYSWCEVKVKMWILNMGKPVNIPVLSQDMAIELGANLLGEGVIFTIGAILLTVEYNRQSNKEAAKEEKREKEMGHINNTIRDLYFTVQKQETQLREMERLVNTLATVNKVKVPPEFGKPQDPPKDGPASNGPPTPVGAPTAAPVQCANTYQHQHEFNVSTPYPNRGIILQALNYVQMDILQTYAEETKQTEEQEPDQPRPRHSFRRESGVIIESLDNIENELKSLF